MKKFFVLNLILLLALLCSACNTSAAPTPTGAPAAQPQVSTTAAATRTAAPTEKPLRYTGLSLNNLPGYLATTRIQFSGALNWVYTVELRKDSTLQEYRLHIEGVEPARNPGDVRLVTDGKTSWLSGPGTDNECFMFPTASNLQPRYYLPDQILAPAMLNPVLTPVGSDMISGADAKHYRTARPKLGRWSNVNLDLWIAKDSNALMRYQFEASGEDPIFKSGPGKLTSAYEVKAITPQTIEPISGCEIQWPIPQDATQLVRMPGLVSFDVNQPPADVLTYYQSALTGDGWTVADKPVSKEGATIASFKRTVEKTNETLQINIETIESGARVQLIATNN